jgi:hypothetical protein
LFVCLFVCWFECVCVHCPCLLLTFSFRLRSVKAITMSSRRVVSEEQASPYHFFKHDVCKYVARRILNSQKTMECKLTCLRTINEVLSNPPVHFTAQCERFASVIWEIPAMQREDKVLICYACVSVYACACVCACVDVCDCVCVTACVCVCVCWLLYVFYMFVVCFVLYLLCVYICCCVRVVLLSCCLVVSF